MQDAPFRLMQLRLFKRLDTLGGWLVFLIAAIVYLMSMATSASLWDCAEFIVTVDKLEVGHPPGAPFFMLIYNVATLFAATPQQVGAICNAVSGLLSAGTIMFLFWSITLLLRRFLFSRTTPSPVGTVDRFQAIATLLAGLGGSLLYTFTDTFWFNAVEAEVYAFSSFLTALVFWLILKWDEHADESDSDRWLVLIAYFVGLGIGVHLLNLLCIPAMALVFYFRKAKKSNLKGALLTLLGSFGLILAIMLGVIQGVMRVASTFDIWAVNSLNMPFNSGLIIYIVLLAASLVWSAWEFKRGGSVMRERLSFLLCFILMGIPFLSSQWWVALLILMGAVYFVFRSPRATRRLLSTIQLSMIVVAIGYSSYGVILVRSAARPPMNENTPSNPVALKKYLNRDQYGAAPLIGGPTFASQLQRDMRGMPIAKGAPKQSWEVAPKESAEAPDRYRKVQGVPSYKYDREMFFPRVHSAEPAHIYYYNVWMGRDTKDYSHPSFIQNLRFFLSYQVGYMYWRYFAWNFIGRQNDLQGHGGMLEGGVSTGLDLIDNAFYGKSKYYPSDIKDNPAHNVYYLMPFLLGLLGIALQLRHGKRGAESFWIVFFLFFMTGLATIFYINQTPLQPRERDYAYAGSFYAFSIWIGFGIAWLAEILQRLTKKPSVGLAVAAIAAVGVPLQMASQNWDDHDRSGRTVAADIGYNTLIGCEPNAILFCFGDNDTFPLWYLQEIEGIRQDINTVNLSYLGAEWYIDAKRMQSYTAAPMPLEHMVPAFYYTYPAAFIDEGVPMSVDQGFEAILRNTHEGYSILPTQQLLLPLDRGQLAARFPMLSVDSLATDFHISLEGKNTITRDGLAIIDMIAANNWERPIYWVKTSPTNQWSNQSDYLRTVGVNWQLTPKKVKGTPEGIDAERTYQLLMNEYRWFGADRKGVYFDMNIRRVLSGLYRGQLFPQTAAALLDQGEDAKAKALIQKAFEVLPAEALPYQYTDLALLAAAYEVGLTEEADKYNRIIVEQQLERLRWMNNLGPINLKKAQSEGIDLQAAEAALACMQLVVRYGRLAQFAEQRKEVESYLMAIYRQPINLEELFAPQPEVEDTQSPEEVPTNPTN